MCEYCDGIYRDGQNVVVTISPFDFKPYIILKDFEKRISLTTGINFCPMCGRKLAEDA